MDYETLKFDIDQGLGIITLNRPEAANAINIPMAKDLLNVAIECEGGAPVTVSYTHLTLPTSSRV